tara:strand:+ start:230 stop:496 length:267 start_codon:yes stop_codon:yes gene_type:complete
MKNLIKRTHFALYILLVAVLFTSCGEWDDDGVDFRNYLRDKHPYSEIKEIDLNGLFSYQVSDTIKGQVWVYTSNRSESSVKGVCVNCN